MNESADTTRLHQQVWNFIPWVINGRASAAEQAAVDAHLGNCIDCREEYEFQRRLHEATRWDDGEERNPQPALRQLWARIEREVPAPVATNGRMKPNWLLRALAAAVIVEAVGLYALGGLLWLHHEPQASPAAQYRTLSSAPASAGRAMVRVVLTPGMTLAEFQKLLEQSQLQVVGGPTDAGVYSLAPTAYPPEASKSATSRLLAQLRAHPAVRFAEAVSVDAGSPP